MRCAIFLFVVLNATIAGAASPFKETLSVKKNKYVNDGVFIGGKATGAVSLLNVRRTFSPKAQIERVIVDLGDKQAQPLGRNMSYFQVNMDSAQNRLVLDLAQLNLSRVSEAAVQNLFRKSPFVASVSLTLDPEDRAGTLVLNFKKPMRLEVYQLLKENAPARIVMDLTPHKKPAGKS